MKAKNCHSLCESGLEVTIFCIRTDPKFVAFLINAVVKSITFTAMAKTHGNHFFFLAKTQLSPLYTRKEKCIIFSERVKPNVANFPTKAELRVVVGWSNCTVGRALAMHVPDPGMIPSTPTVPAVIPKCKASNCLIWSKRKENKTKP